jgi:hypothetical protein
MSIPITDISLVKDEPDKIIWTAEELLRADFPEPRWAVQCRTFGKCVDTGRLESYCPRQSIR